MMNAERIILAFVGAISLAAPLHADDWPQWGGPQRDAVWRETGIVDKLPAVDPQTGMLPRVWTARIGSGYAGPAVAAGRVYVSDRIAEKSGRREPRGSRPPTPPDVLIVSGGFP